MSKINILIIDSDRGWWTDIINDLKKRGFEVAVTKRGADALREIGQRKYRAVVMETNLPDINGIKLFERLKEKDRSISIIFVTECRSIENSIRAIKGGANDYILKSSGSRKSLKKRVIKSIERALKKGQLEALNHKVEDEKDNYLTYKELTTGPVQDYNNILPDGSIFVYRGIVGKSKKMLELFRMIEKISSLPSTVLVEGESGTGKDLIARAIHEMSDRRMGPFVIVSCPAIPGTLIESELFGHEKGAFSDAARTRPGYFELANGGTIFFDEIGAMSKEFQVKLLRVLQEKRIRRIGGTEEIPVDVRVVSTTNSNLDELVKKGEFREDLYYRLNVIRIVVPPLRERKEDIPHLLEYFLKKYAAMFNKNVRSFSDNVIKILQEYHWPGNVRELENMVEHVVAIIDNKEEISETDIPDFDMYKIPRNSLKILVPITNYRFARDKFEREYLKSVLETCRWNISEASRVMGMTRQGLYKKLKRYNLVNYGDEN